MKKTIIALTALAVCIVICLTACGAPKADCYQIYKDAETKTSALKKFSAGVELSLAVDDVGGSAVSMISTTEMDADLTTSRYLQVIGNTDSQGGSQNITLYHEAGVTYYNDGYNSYKYAEDDVSAMAAVSHVADFGLPQSAFAEAVLTDGENGVKTVECTASASSMSTFCNTYLYPINTMTGTENAYELSDVKITLSIDADGFLTSAAFSYSAQFDYSGKKSSAVIDVSVNYTDVTGKTPVEGPDGYADYPEYDSTANSGASEDDMSERDAQAIDAAFSLFEEDHVTPVANYDELYDQYCSEYGKATMDSIIELILAFGSISGD